MLEAALRIENAVQLIALRRGGFAYGRELVRLRLVDLAGCCELSQSPLA
jgi:hypothetical protein